MTVVYKSRPNQQPNRAKAAGFTLLETLIGAVLLVIVFGSLLVTVSYGFTVLRTSREGTRATQIVLERMEGIRLYNWNQVVNSNMISANFTDFLYPPEGGITNSNVRYHLTMTVTNVNLNPMPSYATNMRLVTVSVLWNSDGITRQRSMSTYIAQNGIQNYVFSH